MARKREIDPKLLKTVGRIAGNFERIRKERKWTQSQVVDRADCDFRWYQRLESGKHVYSLDTLVRFAQIFRVDISEFLKED